MKPSRLFALGLLLASSALAASLPTSARAADAPSKASSEAGRVHFQRGVALFKDADFGAALLAAGLAAFPEWDHGHRAAVTPKLSEDGLENLYGSRKEHALLLLLRQEPA